MKSVTQGSYSPEQIQRLFSGIPFFNEVMRSDQEQFDQLMKLCEVLEAEPGEEVIHRGDTDRCLYFLLRGQLAVMADSGEDAKVLNYISPGEVFGTLAMILAIPRSATIRVDKSVKEALVARIDYVHFSDIKDLGRLNLATKLGFYRMVVHNIRWTLEVNRMQNPQHEVATKLRKVPLYTGPRGGPEELSALHDQANALAALLCEWNETPTPDGNMQLT